MSLIIRNKLPGVNSGFYKVAVILLSILLGQSLLGQEIGSDGYFRF